MQTLSMAGEQECISEENYGCKKQVGKKHGLFIDSIKYGQSCPFFVK